MVGIVSLAAIGIALALLVVEVISRSQFDLIFALALGNTILVLLLRGGFKGRRAVVAAIALPLAVIVAHVTIPGIRFSPYLAVALINGLVAYVFGRGVLAGREPLILQLISIIGVGPKGSHSFRRFAYGQTWLWAGFGLLTSLCGFAAMVLPSSRGLTEPAIISLVIVQLGWFVLSHEYANRRYERPETWLGTLRAMSSTTIWAELKL